MKQKKMLALTPSQLKQLYRHELPELTGIAARSGDAQTFKTYLSEYMAGHPQAESEAGKLIRLLIDYDGQKVHELSTDKQLPVSTLSLLYDFLTGKLEEYLETDLFIDLFRQFKRLQHPEHPLPGFQRVKAWSERWLSGLDEDVQQLRAYNKERILHALYRK